VVAADAHQDVEAPPVDLFDRSRRSCDLALLIQPRAAKELAEVLKDVRPGGVEVITMLKRS